MSTKLITSPKEIKALVEKTRWGVIANLICQKLEIPPDPDLFEIRVKEKNGKGFLEVSSRKNLRDLCGIMKNAYEDVRIENFGGGYIKEEDGTIKLIFPVHFSYTHKNGGHNGADIFCLRQDFSTGFLQID